MIYTFDFGEDLHQSDIFKNIPFSCENNTPHFGILLNPECDLIIQESRKSPKAQYLQFAGIIPCDQILDNILSVLRITKSQREGKEYIEGKIYDDFIFLLKNFIHGSVYPRYYFLPPLNDHFSYSVIDFQLIETKKNSQNIFASLKDDRIAKVKSSWKEAIPVRYSTYSSRIGVEDFSTDFIEKMLQDLSISLMRSS